MLDGDAVPLDTCGSCRSGALQVGGVKEISDYVTKLRRVGKGLGVYQFDQVRLLLFRRFSSCTHCAWHASVSSAGPL